MKQLRRETGVLMRAVQRGETVIVTYRGKPVAEMTPIRETAAQDGRDELFGMWRDHDAVASVADFMAEVRKGRVA